MQSSFSSRKLRIVHLHWGFPPIIGGVETHLTMVLPALAAMGHQVTLLTGAVEGAPAREMYQGASIVREPIMDLSWLQKRGMNGLEAEVDGVLSKFLKETQPDVIHTHNMHYFSKLHTQILERKARARKIPLILTAHNTWDDNLYTDLIRKTQWDQIIAVSHFIKKEMIGVGVDDRKITVVHHGVDHQDFSAQGSTAKALAAYPQLKGKRVIFHPARMGLAKGCDVSIKALNLMRERIPDIMLVLAGTKNIIDWVSTQQKEIAYMVDLVEFFKLRKHVLIDAFPLDLMPELYRLSEVCLYPSSVGEPFGLTMLEALATERPMIVTEMGGMPEIVKDGINGFVIPVRDFEALAWRTTELLHNDRLRKRLGYTGRQMVEQHYKIQDVTDHTLGVYEQALKAHHPATTRSRTRERSQRKVTETQAVSS